LSAALFALTFPIAFYENFALFHQRDLRCMLISFRYYFCGSYTEYPPYLPSFLSATSIFLRTSLDKRKLPVTREKKFVQVLQPDIEPRRAFPSTKSVEIGEI
jgi:hypothetical protein